MPPDVNVHTIDAVLEVVVGAGAPNGGVAIDTWHMSKLGIAPDELRRIPVEYLSWVELSRRPGREHGRPRRRGRQPPRAARRGRVRHPRLRRGLPRPRLRRPLGRRGALRGAAQPTRSTSSSGGPTRRPPASSSTRGAPHERTEGVEGLDRDRLVWMFEQMLRIREFEERVKRTFEEHPGVIRGHTHLADGAEASIVGSIATLGPDDQFFTTYRCHGYPIARGTDPKAMMAEIYGRKDGLCKGIGGSMHLTDVSNGFLGTSGIVGAGIPHATGAAWAAQIRGKGQVVLCFFGDGASKQGAFSESLNIASLWKLPIVYVMENNGYNVHTRTEQEDANRAHGEDLSVKAKAFSMPGVTIDGRDPLAVYETVGAAVARARAGEGPTLVESQMYRLSAHGNIIAPPGVPLHFPEHEAIEKFGAPEEYEAAQARRPGARASADGSSPTAR